MYLANHLWDRPDPLRRGQAVASGNPQANANAVGLVDEPNSAIINPSASKTNSVQPINPDDDDDDEDEAFEAPSDLPPPRRPTRPSRPVEITSREASVQIENIPDNEEGNMINSMLGKPSASGKTTSRSAERRFIDRQPDAERVQWSQESPQRPRLPGQQIEPPSSPPNSSAPGERTRQDPVMLDDGEDRGTQEEPSQDRGFQGNTRSNQVVRRAASNVDSSRALPSTLGDSAAAPSPRKRARKNPGQAVDDDEADSPGEDTENRTSGQIAAEINKENKRQARLRRSQTQTRTPWDYNTEVTRLMDLIEEHGPAWSKIKSADEESLNSLALRDQVGLRDKARNLRVDFEM